MKNSNGKINIKNGFRLNRPDIIKVVLNSLLVQSVFTFKEKLGTGFGFMVYPGLKKILKDKESLRDRMLRHTSFFNTHPFLSTYVAGTVLRLEELEGNNQAENLERIDKIKNRLAGILGSLGDRLFWKYLKPFASVVSLVLILVFNSVYPWNIIIGISTFLIIFNSFHLYFRFQGAFSGYRMGTEIIREKSILKIEKINSMLVCIILFILGVLFVIELDAVLKWNIEGIIVFCLISAMTFYLNYKKASPGLGILAGLAFSLIFFLLSTIYSG